MATRQLLAELAEAWQRHSGHEVAFKSMGGVDAARRVREGEAFDVVVLASDAIETLVAAGHVVEGSQTTLFNSGVAVAVRTGAAPASIATAEDVRRAVVAAPSIGYSTGPSGVALMRLFERWGIADEVHDRLVQASPGVPVGTLLARGDVALAFQQFSELIHVEGIDVLGPLPADIQITTTFSGGLCTSSHDAPAVRLLLDFMSSPLAADATRRQGMEPAAHLKENKK